MPRSLTGSQQKQAGGQGGKKNKTSTIGGRAFTMPGKIEISEGEKGNTGETGLWRLIHLAGNEWTHLIQATQRDHACD